MSVMFSDVQIINKQPGIKSIEINAVTIKTRYHYNKS